MSNKLLLKIVVAFGVLAMVLVFLGVNYVPRIFASSSTKESVVDTVILTRSDYNNEHYQRAIGPQLTYGGSDWIERHPSAAAQPLNYFGSDWIERHP